mmetsp:Transcript_21681/g.68687  ORF Transcript_21681/g.68687 Transcript_21681/m.68687 type:complete len:210 (+) Transcript_21681:192-821(+)
MQGRSCCPGGRAQVGAETGGRAAGQRLRGQRRCRAGGNVEEVGGDRATAVGACLLQQIKSQKACGGCSRSSEVQAREPLHEVLLAPRRGGEHRRRRRLLAWGGGGSKVPGCDAGVAGAEGPEVEGQRGCHGSGRREPQGSCERRKGGGGGSWNRSCVWRTGCGEVQVHEARTRHIAAEVRGPLRPGLDVQQAARSPRWSGARCSGWAQN